VTIYEPGSGGGGVAVAVEGAAARLVEAAHAARQFTDTSNFTLRCGVCQAGLKGEKEAVEHARTTGHQNFQEF
jgi:ubiquitin thioesterase OTU1